jgi:hypothetical protein
MAQRRGARGVFDADSFRRIVLGHEGVVEGVHMGHPDFRLNGRIFATLAPGSTRGMVKVSAEQQAQLVADHPEVFAPESGAWGRQGCTRVIFTDADEEVVGGAVTLAWREAAAAGPTRGRRKPPRRRAGNS